MPKINQQTNFYELPDVPSDYRLPNYFSLVIPVGEDRTNLVTNPSFEIDTSNWLASGSIFQHDRSTVYQWVGAYGCIIEAGNGGRVFYGNTTPLSLTSGETYAISMRFIDPIGGMNYDLYIATTGGVRILGQTFKSTGFWQYITFLYTETSTTTRRLYIGPTTGPYSRTFYIDAVQVELTSADKRWSTTYIDGDQRGIIPNSFPMLYYWNGTPHASTSVRSSATRSGGRVVNLRDLGLTISAIAGLALPVPQVVSLPFGQLDGEQYQRTRKEAREFTIAGRVTGRSSVQLDQLFGSLSREFDRDSFSRDEPFILKYQPMDEEELVTGPEIDIAVTYQGGLEGQRNNLNTEIFTATFKQYTPFLVGHDEGSTLSVNISITDADGVVRRKTNGSWDSLGTGLNSSAFAIARGLDGTIYIGGDFTDAGGSGSEFAAKYNSITDTFSAVKSTTAFNLDVNDIAVGPTGLIYFIGGFTNVDGIANADGIVSYNPSTDSFSALGTGLSGGAGYRIAFDSSGNLYAVGEFTSAGGVANTSRIAKWDGSVWTALGTGANAGGVYAIAIRGSSIYAGGSFTLMGGVANTVRLAKWSGSAWTAMSTGANNTVYDLVFSPSGNLFIGGAFTTLGGITINYLGQWNGVTFQVVGSSTSLNNLVRTMAIQPDGILIVGGDVSTFNGISYPDNIGNWDGSSFFPLDIDLPGTSRIQRIIFTPSGELYIGFSNTGTATAAALTTIAYSGTSRSYPIITINGPGSGSSRIYQIANITTGKRIYFDYTILSGEKAVLNFDPVNLSFISTFQGDISSKIIIGSDESNFFIARGNNVISVLSTGSPTIAISRKQCFSSISDAVGTI